jgi:hypothetical protein
MTSDRQHCMLPVCLVKLGLFYDIGNHQNVSNKHLRNTNAFHAFSKSFLNNTFRNEQLLLVSEDLLSCLTTSHAPLSEVSKCFTCCNEVGGVWGHSEGVGVCGG